MTDAEREEFHHFPAVVFVGFAFVIGLPVEPDEHGRVFGDGLKQHTKAAQPLLAEKVYHAGQHFPSLTLVADVAKWLCQKERDSLLGRLGGVEHPVIPPTLNLIRPGERQKSAIASSSAANGSLAAS